MNDTRFEPLSAAQLNLDSIINNRKAQAKRLGTGMISRERFEAKYGKRGVGTLTYSGWDSRWETWQAAERDMLERCVETLAEEGYLAHADIDKIKELLNEPTHQANQRA